MTARPALVVFALAAVGAAVFFLTSPALPPPLYQPAFIGSVLAFFVTLWLLRELRRRDRWAISAGAAALGFLAGLAAASAPYYPWALSYAAAWLPAYLLFMGGVGRERLSFELARLENESDDPAQRPRVKARASAILRDAREAARSLDPEGKTAPQHAGDARAVYAYASQVVAYAEALDERFGEAARALGEVPRAWMPTGMRPLMLSNIAFFHLCERAPDKALAVLDELPEAKAPGQGRAALRVMRAAALVHEGKADAALELIGRQGDDAGEPERLKPRYCIVRAMALVGLGDEAAARAELARARETAEGRAEMKRFLPAAGDARALLDEERLEGDEGG